MIRPSARWFNCLTLLLLASMVSVPLLAQGTGAGMGGGMGGGGTGMGRRGMGMGGGAGRRPDFDPVVLDGPPPPERIDSVMTLDSLQKGRYGTLYQNFMASTKSERDQVKEARESFRNGGADSDPDARQHSRDSMRGAMQTLQDRQKEFDDTLKEFLTKDQEKQYSDWRKARRKEFEDRRTQRGGNRGDRPPPS